MFLRRFSTDLGFRTPGRNPSFEHRRNNVRRLTQTCTVILSRSHGARLCCAQLMRKHKGTSMISSYDCMIVSRCTRVRMFVSRHQLPLHYSVASDASRVTAIVNVIHTLSEVPLIILHLVASCSTFSASPHESYVRREERAITDSHCNTSMDCRSLLAPDWAPPSTHQSVLHPWAQRTSSGREAYCEAAYLRSHLRRL